MKNQRGFTLLEVLVATLIMGIAVAGALSGLSASARNTARLTEYDRATVLAKSKMDELIAEPRIPRGIPIYGDFDSAATGGVHCSWRARVSAYESVPNASAGMWVVDRIELEIFWMDGPTRHAFLLEGFRRGTIQPGDILQ